MFFCAKEHLFLCYGNKEHFEMKHYICNINRARCAFVYTNALSEAELLYIKGTWIRIRI